MKPEKNIYIEQLRGIALMFVLVYHIFCRYPKLFLNQDILQISWLGDFGTIIFMLISSFFLGKTYSGSLRNYYIKKFSRLWPTYFFSVTITFIVLNFLELPGRTCSFTDYLINIFWLNGYIGVMYVDSGHWYMTTLISFVFVAGIIHMLSRVNYITKIGGIYFCYIAWMALAFLTKIFQFNFAYKLIGGSYIGIACIGMILYKYLNEGKEHSTKFKDAIIIFISLAYTLITKGFSYIIYVFCATFMLCTAYCCKKMLESRLLQRLGTASFCIYLIHQNVAYVLEYYMLKAFPMIRFILVGFITLIFVIFCGELINKFVEKPCNKFAKKLLITFKIF